MIPKARAVFLDRDGVINRTFVREGKPYPATNVEEFEILPGVVEGCRRLKQAGFLLVVVTNQPDVGRGTLTRTAVEAIHERMVRLLPIDRVETCYSPGGEQPPDEYRKPRPGMLLSAARELGIDVSRSFMVGDRWRDIDAGHAAGCRTVLVGEGYQEQLKTAPDFCVDDLLHATDVILGLERKEE